MSTLQELPGILQRHVIDEIIFAVDSRQLADLEETFLFCDEEGVRTRVAVDFFPHVNSEVYLDRFGAAPLLTFSAAPHDEIRLVVKRVTDIVLGGSGAGAAVADHGAGRAVIRLTSPGPGDLPAGALRTERAPVRVLQVPLDVRRRGGVASPRWRI